MKGNRTAMIILLSVVSALLIYLLYRAGQQKHVSWYTTYKEQEKQPYDLSVMSKLLDDYFTGKNYQVIRKPVSQSLPLDSSQKSTYIFIGASLFLNDTDLERLYEFVRTGNDVFISASTMPEGLLRNLFQDDESYNYNSSPAAFQTTYQKTVSLNFTHPALKKTGGYWYDFIFEWEKYASNWNYIADSTLMSMRGHKVVTLGNLNEQYASFIKIPFGSGYFYLHTVPIAFTNYYLKQREGLEYADKVFSHLSASDIYWDEFSKVSQLGNGAAGSTETPLRYILSQTSLKWSWYVLLSMVALFLLFRVKRDQRMIPVLEQNANTSLEFIHTIGRLYYLQNDHRSLAIQKMKLFLAFIRNRYALLTKTLDGSFTQKLSEKSQVSKKSIETILEEYRTIENMEDISIEQLSSFHSALESFYQQCK